MLGRGTQQRAPVVSLLIVPHFDTALAFANDSEYGLVASIWTRELGKARAFAREARVGVVKVNRPTTGVPLNAPLEALLQ